MVWGFGLEAFCCEVFRVQGSRFRFGGILFRRVLVVKAL